MSTESFARVKCERCPAAYFRPEGVTLDDLDGDKKPLDVGATLDLAYTESATKVEISLVMADLCPTCCVEIQAALDFLKNRKEPGSWFANPTKPVVVDVVNGVEPEEKPVEPERRPAAATPAATPKAAAPKTDAASPAPKRTKRTMIEMAVDALLERKNAADPDSDEFFDWSASLTYLDDLPEKKQTAFARIFKELRKTGDDHRPNFLEGDDTIWQAHRDALTEDGGDAPQDDEPEVEVEPEPEVADDLDSNETIAPEEVEPTQPALSLVTPTDGFF